MGGDGSVNFTSACTVQERLGQKETQQGMLHLPGGDNPVDSVDSVDLFLCRVLEGLQSVLLSNHQFICCQQGALRLSRREGEGVELLSGHEGLKHGRLH